MLGVRKGGLAVGMKWRQARGCMQQASERAFARAHWLLHFLRESRPADSRLIHDVLEVQQACREGAPKNAVGQRAYQGACTQLQRLSWPAVRESQRLCGLQHTVCLQARVCWGAEVGSRQRTAV